jgi:nucleotide-binding universal stress UspA family protein
MSTGTEPETVASSGPVLLAYDGSELAGFAIEQAAQQLALGREALVLCVWQPVDVDFVPISGHHFDTNDASQVRRAAEETAAHGAAVANALGFQTQSLAVEAAPTWKGIIETATQRQAALIVIGSHRREGIAGHLRGSVAAAVATHAACPVFLVHKRP